MPINVIFIYMSKINENEMGDRMMTGQPYAQGGGLGMGGLGTYSSPDASQNPDQFKNYPQRATSASDISVPTPDDYMGFPTQSVDDYQKDVNSIKYKVTPDEVITGIQYELKKIYRNSWKYGILSLY